MPEDPFEDLLTRVNKCPAKAVESRIVRWTKEFQELWTNESDQWISLTKLLPVNSGLANAENFAALVDPPPSGVSLSTLSFLSRVVSDKFEKRYWKDQLSENSVRLCAGLLNVLRLVDESSSEVAKSTLDELHANVTGALTSYPVTLMAVEFYHPQLVQFSKGKCQVLNAGEIEADRLGRRLLAWNEEGKAARESLADFLKQASKRQQMAIELCGEALALDATRILDLMRLMLQEGLKMPYQAFLIRYLDPVPPDQLRNNSRLEDLVMAAIQKDDPLWDDDRRSVLWHHPFPSQNVSDRFRTICSMLNRLTDDQRKEAFRLWAGYLVSEDAFAYGWIFLHAEALFGKNPLFGTGIDERISALRDYLIQDRMEFGLQHQHMGRHNKDAWHVELKKKQAWIEFFRALMSLLEMPTRSYRGDVDFGEAGVRYSAAVDALSPYPDTAPIAVCGILDLAEEHWNRLDPILLGLPKGVVVPALLEYVKMNQNRAHTKRFHAGALLRHAQGEPFGSAGQISAGSSGVLGAVENLIEVSRSRISRDRSQTWLGDIGVETLWQGAAEAACKEFATTFDTQGGQDEHELVFLLATQIASHLKSTNATIQSWLTDRRTMPVSIGLSVRRFQRKQKHGISGEGGATGTSADLGIIFVCDVPGLAQASRITLIQAKKVWAADTTTWPGTIPIDVVQLTKLLQASDQGHYLFMLRSTLAPAPLIVPGRCLQDLLSAQSSRTVPIPVILRAAKELPSFLVHDVVGLWSGDTDEKLVRATQDGANIGVGPMVMVEIRVSASHEPQG